QFIKEQAVDPDQPRVLTHFVYPILVPAGPGWEKSEILHEISVFLKISTFFLKITNKALQDIPPFSSFQP
ncbi:MAG: hypothetical protein V2B13_19185, partial [Pseudomonadota bacterium]